MNVHSVVRESLSDKVSCEQRDLQEMREGLVRVPGDWLQREGRLTTELGETAEGARR